jgi:hypothetical protein
MLNHGVEIAHRGKPHSFFMSIIEDVPQLETTAGLNCWWGLVTAFDDGSKLLA